MQVTHTYTEEEAKDLIAKAVGGRKMEAKAVRFRYTLPVNGIGDPILHVEVDIGLKEEEE